MSVTVRRAQASDLDWLLTQLRDADAHYRRSMPIFSEHSEGILSSVVASGVVLIAEREGERLGFLAGAYHPSALNPDIRQLTALVLWVAPHARREGAATRLIEEFTSFGEETADWVVIAVSELSGLPSELFTDRGYLVQERAYLKEVG